MKKTYIIVLLLFINNILIFSQDYILLKNGEEIEGWVIEINEQQIIYTGLQDTITNFAVPIPDVFMVKYMDGQKFVFANKPTYQNESTNSNTTEDLSLLSEDEIKMKAISDANTFYNCKPAQWATGCSTCACWPAGIGVAAATSGTPPNDKNLRMPEFNYTNNNTYHQYYKAEAKRIKKQKVWQVFGICMAINIPFIIISYMSEPY